MKRESFIKDKRDLKTVRLNTDLVVTGGGLSGVCAAITAARAGINVVLIHDRPVLGGNASSEVRLWILGATSHMGNNNRWAREGGVIDEILLENTYRNREGNPVLLDTIILEKVKEEERITLLLNTAVYDIGKSTENKISGVYAFCSQNYTFYEVSGNLFCDASGDGIVAYRAGAGFRMGAEEKIEFGELFAPDKGEYGELLGHSIYFYSKDTGAPVTYTPPSYALKDITKLPRYRNIRTGEHGCKYWWLEYGGRKDTIHDTEEIKWELWSVVYGVWDYIKNSGAFPEAENQTLEWVGVIPGKRESRRFTGHYTLIQQDIIEQRHFEDAVAFGGWAIDLHPADGVYSHNSGCIQYHSKGIYEIPYRCYISKDLENLFFAGRCISTSHVAHGSSRVMATSALGGQAVGMAAAHCIQKGLLPADLLYKGNMTTLQQDLNLAGQSIPFTAISPAANLADKAVIETSGTTRLDEIPFDGDWVPLEFSAAQMLPLVARQAHTFEIEADVLQKTTLQVELRCAEKPHNYTPETIIEQLTLRLNPGVQRVSFRFSKGLPDTQYGFVTFLKNKQIRLRTSQFRCSGILSVFNKFNYDVNNTGKQTPPPGSGIDTFEFWCPDRRPRGENIAMHITPHLAPFAGTELMSGRIRPAERPHAWVAPLSDTAPVVTLTWEEPVNIRQIILYFDTDYDQPLESVQMGHPEQVMPFCVRDYRITDEDGRELYRKEGNFQTINRICLPEKIITRRIRLHLSHPSQTVPAGLFQVYIK